MKKAVIFNYGRLNNEDLIKKELSNADYLLCADGGGNYAYDLGIIPDFLIGDFDSIEEHILSYYKQKNVNIIKYNTNKDFTDTELCINKAIELGCDTICIIGGVGGRIDHTIANINLLHYIKSKNKYGYFVTDEFYIYLCNESIKINGKRGDIVSLIPLYKNAIGLYSKGLKYKLDGSDIEFGRPLGISNIMVDDICEISIADGEILVFKKI